MCGIFGILSSSRFVSEDLLRKAVSTLAHRGPDDAGTVIIQDSPSFGLQLGLAHTRLSIIDLSPLGHQPMQDPATGNWLVFNGEIYNFRELRNELSALGADFKSHSDTEVILAAYRVWGESCLERLQGMFALALWDAPRKQLLLVRDPMGIKPLYYHQSNQAFIFASEVRTFLRTGLVPRKVDSTGLLSYLEFGSVYEPWTIVEGIRAVPPGCALTLQNRSVSSRRYWTPLHSPSFAPSVPSSGNGNVATDRLPSLLRHAVLSHLVSDVPVGVFLSGGIDSSAIVAILSLNGVRANTFSLVFQEEEFNEAQYSREIARYFRTEHHEIPLLPQDALAVLPEALCAMDQPTIDGINTYLVSAKTRAAGVKVALTGLGADEMFAGYSNFRRVPKMELFSKGLRQLPRLARRPLALSIGLFAGKGDRSRKVSDLATDSRSVLHPYFLARMLFGKAEREALFSRSDSFASQQSLDKCLQESAVESQSLDPVNRVSYFESIFYMRNTLLETPIS